MKAAHYTREHPVTKVELHNCFYHLGRYVNRPVVEVKAEIGLNAPKYLLRESFVVERSVGGTDFYCITPAGEQWLRHGILRYLQLHPDRIVDCREVPPGYVRGRGVEKRSKPAQAQEKATSPASRVIRRSKG